jgi:YhcH/YjgK/YiaL family protein
MVFDHINHANVYFCLHPLFAAAFEFISEQSRALPPGRIEMQPMGMYALIQEFEPQPVSDWLLEAHKRYIDIQYLEFGSETIYHARADTLEMLSYDQEKDYVAMRGEGQPLKLGAGDFCILLPQDAHLANRLGSGAGLARKVVLKIPLAY